MYKKNCYQLLEGVHGFLSRTTLKGQDLQNGRWNSKSKLEEGAVPLKNPPHCLSPKEHDEVQVQIDALLA